MAMRRWLSVLALGVLLSSCASAPKPGVCAAIGGVLGGGGGVAVGASTPDHNSDEQAIYGGAGAILGASTGYLICRAMQEEPAPPPPPPPPAPRAAPPPAPVTDHCAEVVRLRGVNFDFDKADIRPDAAVVLDEAAALVAGLLRECPNDSLAVEGHTDAIGTDTYNQALSERRAGAVMDYLAGKGVSSAQLSAKGFGESAPIAANDTADGRALNRRVELRLVQ